MAKLPDGWIFIPRMKDITTVDIEKRELVCCRHCKHYDDKQRALKQLLYGKCRLLGIEVEPSWFCCSGENYEEMQIQNKSG